MDFFCSSLCGKLGRMRDIDCDDFPRHQWKGSQREGGRVIEGERARERERERDREREREKQSENSFHRDSGLETLP